jgi:hypothetical protein
LRRNVGVTPRLGRWFRWSVERHRCPRSVRPAPKVEGGDLVVRSLVLGGRRDEPRRMAGDRLARTFPPCERCKTTSAGRSASSMPDGTAVRPAAAWSRTAGIILARSRVSRRDLLAAPRALPSLGGCDWTVAGRGWGSGISGGGAGQTPYAPRGGEESAWSVRGRETDFPTRNLRSGRIWGSRRGTPCLGVRTPCRSVSTAWSGWGGVG